MKKFIPLLLILFILACNSRAKEHSEPMNKRQSLDDSMRVELEAMKKKLAEDMAGRELTYFIINVPDEKFGYSIFIDGKMYIEQRTIPAVEGNNGFSKKEDAEKVAQLVIEKIKQGEMPPTISVEELKGLDVIK
ncbi:MAG TPA: DUF4907 domain-containing protein [Saprospiraceae bacterium]|nr:DUF4907 domain-containing protein [Saprospiraceae bacterium]